MEKLRLRQVVLVEGRYDAAKLAGIVDALILTTDGFAIYKDKEKKELLKELGRRRGVLILTDSDGAGFQIRNYVSNLVGQQNVLQAYVPAIHGKESRKAQPGKEGLLGVEGVPDEAIRQAILASGAVETPKRAGREITYLDLYEWGLSGTAGSADARRRFLETVGLPPRLSKKALCQVLSSLYTWEELDQLICGPQAAVAELQDSFDQTEY